MNIRSEETKRAITFSILEDNFKVSVNVSASCQVTGSHSAVEALFCRARMVLEEEFGPVEAEEKKEVR